MDDDLDEFLNLVGAAAPRLPQRCRREGCCNLLARVGDPCGKCERCARWFRARPLTGHTLPVYAVHNRCAIYYPQLPALFLTSQ